MLRLIQSILNGLKTTKKTQRSGYFTELHEETNFPHTKLNPLGYNKAKIIKQLKTHEGEKLIVYKCTAGKLTIGIGRNLEARGISKEESAIMLSNDIRQVADDLVMKIPWFNELDDVRKRVLIDMAFNLGTFGLMQFKTTLQQVSEGKYDQASRSMLNSKWAKQVRQRAQTLSIMMSTGCDPEFLW